MNNKQDTVDVEPAVIKKYDGKTVRVWKRGYGGRVYRVSIEYIPGEFLEVGLRPLAQDGSFASSTFDWRTADSEEVQQKGELYMLAVRKAKDIAREIEQAIDVDFDEEEVQ